MRTDKALNLKGKQLNIEFDRTRPRDGASFSGHESNTLFLNLGFGAEYVDLSAGSGLDHPGDSRVSCFFDYDRDGWIDLAVVNANAPMLQLYRNRIGEVTNRDAHFVALRFVGGNHTSRPESGLSNRDGYGARIRVTAGGRTVMRERPCGEGFAGRNGTEVLVGLGDATTADRIEVRWPGGTTQVIEGVASGSRVTAYEVPAQSPSGESFVVAPYGTRTGRAGTVAKRRSATPFPIPAARTAAKVRVYTTMATWCVNCKKQYPRLRALKESLGEDVALYGVAIDEKDTAEKLAEYMRDQEPGFELVSGVDAAQLESLRRLATEAIGDAGVPTCFVVDAENNLRMVLPAAPTISDLNRIL